MFSHSLFRGMQDDPFFADAREQMRRMDNMFSRPADFPPMLEDGRGRDRGRDRSRDRPSGSRELAPFEPGFGFGNMFPDMNKMMSKMMENTDRAFASAASNPDGHSFQQASFYSYQKNGEGPAKIFQSSSSTRTAPGGIKETHKALKDTERDLEKMAIGHHIYDRGHVIERHKNTRTNDVDERQDYIGIDENEAGNFDREWEEKTRQTMRGLDYDRRKGRSKPVDYREERYERPRRERREERPRYDERHRERPRQDLKALPPSHTEHWGRTRERDRGRE